ncbi:hypothetical protein NP493_149g03023 [Ridgeia piscesae]|uniref:BSD domain-containing protein n=1 Tax=Ridgeia piscesae TaxID=27915 RepID=A0AAD9P4E5_RIDPI|nr:hypothetical protein NP493_149g03023 [Ridgeia piscesae]
MSLSSQLRQPTTKTSRIPPKESPATTDAKTAEKEPEKEESVTEESQHDALHQMQFDLDEVSTKAVNTAKEWGSYLYTFGKAATEQVTKTAMHLKETVEEKTILGEFVKEQGKFVSENTEKKKLTEAAIPPWIGYNEEEAMKKQILALSSDKRNFLRNPPAGVQFHFDFATSHPVAMAILQEDPSLEKMRFDLVPKQINEENFWRNYFYRVSLIKQSTQLTSLAKQTGCTGEGPARSSSSKSLDKMPRDDTNSPRATTPIQTDSVNKLGHPEPAQTSEPDPEPEDLPASSPVDHEFISDAFPDAAGLDAEDLKEEMQQLGMTEGKKDDNTDGKVGMTPSFMGELASLCL